jgi:uncharacterized protein
MAQGNGKMPSPCVDICVFDKDSGWCVGCGRTRVECNLWKSAPRRQQRAIAAALPRRLRALAASGLKRSE